MSRVARYLPLVVGLLLTVGFLRLGAWQAERAHGKEQLFARFDRASARAPVPLGGAPITDFAPVVASGRWRGDARIYHENQVLDGRDGVHLFVPLVQDDGTAYLVNLGWQPMPPTRELPAPAPLPEAEALPGLVAPPPAGGLRLGELDLASQQAPFRVPWLDLASLGERLGLELAPRVVLATGPSDLFRRSWRPRTLPPERHQAYAFQWRALAVAVAGFTLWGGWRLVATTRQRRPLREPDES